MTGEIDLTALTAWMDRVSVGAGAIHHVVPMAGGTQNIMLKFERDGVTYVLRHPPAHLRPNSNATMRREARLLAALADTAVPHPKIGRAHV